MYLSGKSFHLQWKRLSDLLNPVWNVCQSIQHGEKRNWRQQIYDIDEGWMSPITGELTTWSWCTVGLPSLPFGDLYGKIWLLWSSISTVPFWEGTHLKRSWQIMIQHLAAGALKHLLRRSVHLHFQCACTPSGNGIVEQLHGVDCSVQEVVYWYNVMPNDGVHSVTVLANSL